MSYLVMRSGIALLGLRHRFEVPSSVSLLGFLQTLLLKAFALQTGLQVHLDSTWPFKLDFQCTWTSTLDSKLGSAPPSWALYCQNAFQLGLQVPSTGCPGTLKIELPCRRRAHLSKTALQVYFKLTWTPLGLNLGSLGRLLGSTWDLLEASWAQLGAPWMPF